MLCVHFINCRFFIVIVDARFVSFLMFHSIFLSLICVCRLFYYIASRWMCDERTRSNSHRTLGINLHIGFTWLAYNRISQRTKFTFLSVERICVTPSTLNASTVHCFYGCLCRRFELCTHLYVFSTIHN